MGFRDLHTFNMAMLAKQSWRLISKPDSFCAKVGRPSITLIAHYYMRGQKRIFLYLAKYCCGVENF
jgi:hypothetical protein